ncbi:circularly permuted type 2 ATP-grasp protein [Megamonas hypermegale]|uniref:circularly permuted type 2 ATP-grasp protein n=1 Tax=Megamonas hypermegale TaxID=158847 RepID=UPI00320BA581
MQEDYLYFKNYTGSLEKIGALYRRISDDYLDPMTFREDSLIGIPHLMEIYKKGNVALINAPGNGVADDKGIYYFVPKMIEYYLGEKPILHNAPTYLPYYKEDLQFILDNFDRLVIKDVAEAGGYGVFFANTLTPQLKDKFIAKLLAKPRRFIAQEVIDFKGLEILDGDQLIERKADLRAFVLSGETTKVWKSGLTRFSRNPDSFIVNSSQGGGFKDTWILSR